MTAKQTQIETPHGRVRLPAYIPVTTFGPSYPLDRLIQPFLGRYSDMLMVSYHFAKQMKCRPSMPMFIDSGGFAGLLDGYNVVVRPDGTGCIEKNCLPGIIGDGQLYMAISVDKVPEKNETITPESALDLQNLHADFGATLDFPIPPGMTDPVERQLRIDLTLVNARWVMKQAQAGNVKVPRMFGSVQGWDVESYVACGRALVAMGFVDLAIGGMVPRAREKDLVVEICTAVAAGVPDGGMLHVFGIGEPQMVARLFAAGATSIDSSSYVQSAVSGRQWGGEPAIADPSALDRAHAALRNLAFATRS